MRRGIIAGPEDQLMEKGANYWEINGVSLRLCICAMVNGILHGRFLTGVSVRFFLLLFFC